MDGSCRSEQNSCTKYGISNKPYQEYAENLSDSHTTQAAVKRLVQIINGDYYGNKDAPANFRVYNYNPNPPDSYPDQRIIFFYYHDQKGYVKVTKNFEGVDWTNQQKYNFCQNNMSMKVGDTTLVHNGDCTWNYGLDSSNKPTLELGTSVNVTEEIRNTAYSFKTYFLGNDITSTRQFNAIVENVGDVNTAYAGKNDVTVTNAMVKYCLSFKKTDLSDAAKSIVQYNKTNSAYLNEIPDNAANSEEYYVTITICSDRNGTTDCHHDNTDSDGIVTFNDLTGSSYYYKETLNSNTTNYYNNEVPNFSTNPVTASSTSCPQTIISNEHKQWCTKVRKVDALTGEPLQGVAIDLYKTQKDGSLKLIKNNVLTNSDGYATFTGLYDNNISNYPYVAKVDTEQETHIYNNSYVWDGTAVTINNLAIYTGNNTCDAVNEETLKNYPYTIGWYKITEKGNKASGAKFKVSKSNGTPIKAKAEKENGCYVYDPTGTVSEFVSDSEGYTCIKNITKDETYTVEEIKPAEFHTFDSTNTKTVTPFMQTTNETKAQEDNSTFNNVFINQPTKFEFTKEVSSGDGDTEITIVSNNQTRTLSLTELTTEELMNIDFNITDSNNNVLSFIEKSSGVYEYYSNTIDLNNGSNQTPTTNLHLDTNRKIYVYHLPWGTYSIKEKNTKTCDNSSDYTNCIGYYYPDYSSSSSYEFTIDECSNPNANSTLCTGKTKTVKKSLINTPTEITFTKKDFYHYQDQSDVITEGNENNNTTAEFENAKERSDFDRIDFKIKDSDGRYLTLKFIGNHGTCLTDDSYSEYRYVYGDSSSGTSGTVMHTCGGHIKITNLCRGKKYIVEEASVPDDSVYVLDSNENNEVEYQINCTGEEDKTTQTKLINDKPTRVRFEKRDSKYNYLIPDETTTFKVYQCPKGQKCHPADGVTTNMKLMKFTERAVINGDEEDPSDAEGYEGVEVYKSLSDSDIQKGDRYVTELHPYNGILVLRYLPSGYNYVLLETVAPKNYTLPKGRNAETEFTVVNNTVSVREVDVANVPTSLIIRKYDENGNLLTGAKFRIYQKDSCDANLSAKNQIKDELKYQYILKLKTIRDGVYEARPIEDTDVITTCSGTGCSSISTNAETKLTYSSYLDTFADFKNLVTKENEKLNLQEGEALIQYLEYGKCYIIEEIKAPDGYSLPKKEEDRFTMVTIEENETYAYDTKKALVNKPTPFTFYKFDEYNNLLDGAEFKLQKLNEDKIYQDVPVTKEEKDDKYYYKVDKDSTNYTINTKNGSATVYYLEEGQYRIVETKAAEGKELNKNPNIATFFVDENGNVYGNSIIVNKAKTEKYSITPKATAEFIVNIQTGQTVIKYGLIIALISIIISALMLLNSKTGKKRVKNEKK